MTTREKPQGRNRKTSHTTALEVTTTWSQTKLDVRLLQAKEERLTLGERQGCDIPVPPSVLGEADHHELIALRGGKIFFQLPPGATSTIEFQDDDDERYNVEESGRSLSLNLKLGWEATIELGELTFSARPVCPEQLQLPWRRPDFKSLGLLTASLVAHAVFLAVAFSLPPSPQPITLDLLAEDNRFSRLIIQPPEILASEIDDWVEAAATDEGQMGVAGNHAGNADQRFGIHGPASRGGAHMARSRSASSVGSSGILAALNSQSPTSPFGQNTALRNDPENAMGSLMGNQIGDEFGYGGLGLRGTGRGGGGNGARGVGLGNLNTIGHGGGGGSGSGYGRGAGGLRGRRAQLSPRCGNGVHCGEEGQMGLQQQTQRLLAGPSTPLPQNGMLASNFVGGRGVETRLSDLLDRGVMVDGQNVRIEAFQDRNALPYAVPAEEAVAMYAELERSRVVAGGDRLHLQIALMARQGELPQRPRMDIRLVLDRSGSMDSGGKWQSAVASVHALVDSLRPGDVFGLITYSDTATLALPPREVRQTRELHREIDQALSGGAGGGTNISSGLQLASRNRPQRRSPSDLGLVVLISDGMATSGLRNPRDLGDISRQMFDEDGVLTTTIGLGTEFDEQTMLTLAREGNGSYHFVRRPADISSIVEDELAQRAQAVAQALRLRVVTAEGVQVMRVYGSRMLNEQEHAAVRATEVAIDQRLARELGIVQDRSRENEEGLRIHLGSFRRSDQHVILMELDVPAGTVGSEAEICQVFLDYKDLSDRSNQSTLREVTADRVRTRDASLASLRRNVKRTVLAFQAGDALQQAAEALQVGRIPVARRVLAERRQLLEAAADLWRDPTLRQDAMLISRYETVLNRAYPSWGDQDQRTLALAMNYFGDRRMR